MRILCIERNPDILEIILQSLTDEGFDVVGTLNPERALELLQEETFLLLVSSFKYEDDSLFPYHLPKFQKWHKGQIFVLTGAAEPSKPGYKVFYKGSGFNKFVDAVVAGFKSPVQA